MIHNQDLRLLASNPLSTDTAKNTDQKRLPGDLPIDSPSHYPQTKATWAGKQASGRPKNRNHGPVDHRFGERQFDFGWRPEGFSSPGHGLPCEKEGGARMGQATDTQPKGPKTTAGVTHLRSHSGYPDGESNESKCWACGVCFVNSSG